MATHRTACPTKKLTDPKNAEQPILSLHRENVADEVLSNISDSSRFVWDRILLDDEDLILISACFVRLIRGCSCPYFSMKLRCTGSLSSFLHIEIVFEEKGNINVVICVNVIPEKIVCTCF
jgi:hypothetical protein